MTHSAPKLWKCYLYDFDEFVELQLRLAIKSLIVDLKPLTDAIDFLEMGEKYKSQFRLLDDSDEELENGFEVVDLLFAGEGVSKNIKDSE
jgi:hypothetical protein